MSSSLHILHLEDNSRDAELVRSILEAEGLDCIIRHARNKEEFQTAIAQEHFDVILSDFALPNYNGLAALAEVREHSAHLPFILLSGTVGEEVAVKSLKTGATDYILKQNPVRLPQAILRALEEAAERERRQKAEVRLREQAALLDKAQDAIHVRDMQQCIRYWNRGSELVYGWTVADALGRCTTDLFAGSPHMEPANAQEQILVSGEWTGELQHKTRDGRVVIVESRWTLMRDHLNNPDSILVINTDITERKHIEAQLLRTQRMETIGALAAGIVHDLNNVLAPVLMAADVLEESQTTDENRQMLNLVRTSAERGRNMLKQILSFTRGVSGENSQLELNRLVEEMARLASATFPRRVRIETAVAPDLHLVHGNATQLHQVLLNLCVNARDAMPDGGAITIRAENLALKNFRSRWHDGELSGEFVRITVSDTGHGIAPATMAKLFEPFFTTKENGKGTGLGLSTAMGIIKHHRGFLEVQSEPGKGTSFMVYLPAIPRPTQTDLSLGNSRISEPESLSCH